MPPVWPRCCCKRPAAPGELTPAQVRSTLQSTALAHTLQNVTITANTANPARVRLGVAAPGMLVDRRAVTTGFPLTLGTLKNLTPAQVSFVQGGPLPNTQFAQLTMNFAVGAFGNKSSLAFGVDRDERASGGGGNAAELMAGATVTGTVIAPGNISTPFTTTMTLRQVAKGYSPLDGFGLIDALSAVHAVTP